MDFLLCFGYSNKAGKSGTPPIFELPIATVSCFGTTFIQGNTVLISSSSSVLVHIYQLILQFFIHKFSLHLHTYLYHSTKIILHSLQNQQASKNGLILRTRTSLKSILYIVPTNTIVL